MSGIYIPGLEMPDCGYVCLKVLSNGEVLMTKECRGALVVTGIRDKVGTAVPVPDHGRLIDADAFKNYMMQAAIDSREDALTDEIHRRVMDAAKALLLDIDEAPTVIPADKEATEE